MRVAAPIALVGLLLAGWSVAPANADPSAADDPVQIGLGNGITASIDPVTSKVALTTGTQLAWEPDLMGFDHLGYGSGWTLKDTPFVDRNGRMAFYFPKLHQFFEMDLSSPTGLYGYPGDDVLVSDNQSGAQVPARSIANQPEIPAQPYLYSLHHLDTNVTEYYRVREYSYNLDLVATIDHNSGARTDWVFNREIGRDGELLRIVAADGATTTFERIDSRLRRISPPTTPPVTLTLGDGRIARYITATTRTVFEPYGGPEFGYWLSSQDSSTGARTDFGFTWDPANPGRVTRVDRLGPDGIQEVIYPIQRSSQPAEAPAAAKRRASALDASASSSGLTT
jgi:hypothetical protein